MFCEYCGKEIENDAEFCAYCGKRVKNGDSAYKGESGGDERAGKVKKSEKPRKKKVVYMISAVLIAAAAAAVIFFVLIKPKTGNDGRDDETWDREVKSEREDAEEKEFGKENAGEDAEAEDAPFAATEQLRASLENVLHDLEMRYGYANLGTRSMSFDFEEYNGQPEWNVWTGLSGIAEAEILDLDGDGQEELFVILLEEKNIYLRVYEADAGMPAGAPEKSAEVILERSADIHNYEDVCRLVEGDGVKYLLFLQAYWGGWGDGYYARAKLYQYDGTKFYTPITVEQEAEASAEFVYFVRQYETDGTMLSEEVIYDDMGQYGTYMDADYCRERMKELFEIYGIGIGDRAEIYIYDGNFDEFLAPEIRGRELMKLRMESSVIIGNYDYFHFVFNSGVGTTADAGRDVYRDSNDGQEKPDWNEVRLAYLAYLEAQEAFEPWETEAGGYIHDEYNTFSLDYVDGDDIPEMIYGHVYYWDGKGYSVLYYDNKAAAPRKIRELTLSGSASGENGLYSEEDYPDSIGYIEGTGMINAEYGYFGSLYREDHIYQLINGEFVHIADGDYDDSGDDRWNGTWDGVNVTRQEYEERKGAVYAKYGNQTYNRLNYTPDQIKDILETPRTSEELRAFLESEAGY